MSLEGFHPIPSWTNKLLKKSIIFPHELMSLEEFHPILSWTIELVRNLSYPSPTQWAWKKSIRFPHEPKLKRNSSYMWPHHFFLFIHLPCCNETFFSQGVFTISTTQAFINPLTKGFIMTFFLVLYWLFDGKIC
jgi:hypothetical protein